MDEEALLTLRRTCTTDCSIQMAVSDVSHAVVMVEHRCAEHSPCARRVVRCDATSDIMKIVQVDTFGASDAQHVFSKLWSY
jgi:hypothetical protein